MMDNKSKCNNDKIALILAAGSIKTNLGSIRSRSECVALTPLYTRCLAAHVIDFYKKHSVYCYLVVDKKYAEQVNAELAHYTNSYQLLCVSNTSNPNETMKQALNYLDDTREIIVNLATSIPNTLINQHEALLGKDVETSEHWSSISFSNGIPQFNYHQTSELSIGNPYTGIVCASKGDFEKALAVSSNDRDFLSTLEQLHKSTTVTFIYDEWIDCGHDVNYFEARKKLISSRSFNSIRVNEYLGVITKTSEDAEKFTKEINYINMLPQRLNAYFPRTFGGVNHHDGKASVDMEYYGYPTLAEYLLFWDLDQLQWNRVIKSISHLLTEFSSFKYRIGLSAHNNFYHTKTLERIASFRSQLSPAKQNIIDDDYLHINGNKYENYPVLQNRIEQKISDLYDENDFCVFHGDLCFNNMLYDMFGGSIRLIDARGSFGDDCIGIYGDRKYDLAKLAHSTIGGYDYIVSDLFQLEILDKSISYSIAYRDNKDCINQLMKGLIEEHGLDYSDILFIVGLLFVSMCPLHSDRPDRQITMYCHGITFINEALEKK